MIISERIQCQLAICIEVLLKVIALYSATNYILLDVSDILPFPVQYHIIVGRAFVVAKEVSIMETVAF